METGRFWPIRPFGARNGKICFEFLLLCCRPRKGRFSMETGRFWPICPLGARNGKICFEFLLLCCRPRKSRFSMETGRFWAICPSGPEMVKFALNSCYCAVDQEKAVFQWKRAVSGPSALWAARNGKICFEFLLLCCRPRKNHFSMETSRFWQDFKFKACPAGRHTQRNLAIAMLFMCQMF